MTPDGEAENAQEAADHLMAIAAAITASNAHVGCRTRAAWWAPWQTEQHSDLCELARACVELYEQQALHLGFHGDFDPGISEAVTLCLEELRAARSDHDQREVARGTRRVTRWLPGGKMGA